MTQEEIHEQARLALLDSLFEPMHPSIGVPSDKDDQCGLVIPLVFIDKFAARLLGNTRES